MGAQVILRGVWKEIIFRKSGIGGNYKGGWIKKNTEWKTKIDCFFNIQTILLSFFSDKVVVISSKTTISDTVITLMAIIVRCKTLWCAIQTYNALIKSTPNLIKFRHCEVWWRIIFWMQKNIYEIIWRGKKYRLFSWDWFEHYQNLKANDKVALHKTQTRRILYNLFFTFSSRIIVIGFDEDKQNIQPIHMIIFWFESLLLYWDELMKLCNRYTHIYGKWNVLL